MEEADRPVYTFVYKNVNHRYIILHNSIQYNFRPLRTKVRTSIILYDYSIVRVDSHIRVSVRVPGLTAHVDEDQHLKRCEDHEVCDEGEHLERSGQRDERARAREVVRSSCAANAHAEQRGQHQVNVQELRVDHVRADRVEQQHRCELRKRRCATMRCGTSRTRSQGPRVLRQSASARS